MTLERAPGSNSKLSVVPHVPHMHSGLSPSYGTLPEQSYQGPSGAVFALPNSPWTKHRPQSKTQYKRYISRTHGNL